MTQCSVGSARIAVKCASTEVMTRRRNSRLSILSVSSRRQLDVPALLDSLARDLVTEDHTGRSRGAAAYHVLVAAADVRRRFGTKTVGHAEYQMGARSLDS